MKKLWVFTLFLLLVSSSLFAREPQEDTGENFKVMANVMHYCKDRVLYLVGADNSLRDLSDMNSVKKMVTRRFNYAKDCYASQLQLNRLIRHANFKSFLVAGDSKFYWVDSEITMDSLLSGEIKQLPRKYSISTSGYTKLLVEVNGTSFVSGLLGKILLTPEEREEDQLKKQAKLLKKYFHNGYRN